MNYEAKEKKKKTKNLIIALAMVAILAIGAISAYFTATDSATNTFTVGNVTIDQTEPSWDSTDGNTPNPTPDTEVPDPNDPDSPKGDKWTDKDGDGVIDSTQVTPNKEFLKDPTVTNKGNNDAYVYTMVAIPKKTVDIAVTTNGDAQAGTAQTPAAGKRYQSRLVQLFQMNRTANAAGSVPANQMNNTVTYRDSYNSAETAVLQPKTDAQATNDARSWTGVDTFNSDDWYLLDVNPASSGVLAPYKDKYNIYLFAYAKNGDGTKATLTKLAGAKNKTSALKVTPALFSSVTFANIVNVNDGASAEDSIDYDSKLEGTVPEIVVKSFAIQCENITSGDTADAASVWSILNEQDGAYAALKDELDDNANNSFEAPVNAQG